MITRMIVTGPTPPTARSSFLPIWPFGEAIWFPFAALQVSAARTNQGKNRPYCCFRR